MEKIPKKGNQLLGPVFTRDCKNLTSFDSFILGLSYFFATTKNNHLTSYTKVPFKYQMYKIPLFFHLNILSQ